MSNEKISIIVPCYNVENYIVKCINSIKEQTYNNLEVLMINDGSKDSTEDIIKEMIKNDNRFSYYYKENGGSSDARNYGLEKYTGEYVCFIDSDDYIEKDYIELLYKAIKENDVKISVCGFNRVYENKINIDKMTTNIIDYNLKPAAWNKMYHRSLFEENILRFPVGKWYEDLGTTSKILFLVGEKYAIVDKPLYNYIQNGSSIMHTYDDRIFQIYDIMDSIEIFCKENKIYNKFKGKIEAMYIYHILIGTIYRSSFHKEFSKSMINDIINHVEKKYPDWYNNDFIKNQSIIYKTFLKCVKCRNINILYFLLKHFSKYFCL